MRIASSGWIMLARFQLARVQYKYLVAAVFIVGLFMDMVDLTVVNVAIPDLSKEFAARTSAVEWTVTGYMLSLAVFIPAAGFLSDRFGTKKAFLTAMAIFIIASGLCGQARSLEELVAFRVLQGIGGGMMTPVGTAMLSREFPGAERAKASAIISVPIVFAPMVGPVFGGYLVEYVSWRWIFYINLPIGIAGFIFALKVLKEHKEPYAQGRFDFAGLVTGSAGAALVLYALSQAATAGWTDSLVMGFGFAGLALLILFTFIELRAHPPMIDLKLFKRPLFSLGNGMLMPAFATFSGLGFVFTLFLQEFQGRSPLHAGLIQAPAAIGSAFMLPLASRLYTRVGPKKLLVGGFAGSVFTMLPFAFLTHGTPAWLIIILLMIRGLPFAFAMVPAQTIIYGPLESEKQGPASSTYNTLRQVAGSFGVALIATIQLNHMHSSINSAVASQHLTAPTPAILQSATQSSYQLAFLVVALAMLIPLVLALFVDNSKAQETLRKREMAKAAEDAHKAEAAHAPVSAAH